MESFFEALVPASFSLIVLLLIIGLIAFVFSASKTKKQKAYLETLHKELVPGAYVMFCGGIFGEIVKVKPDEVEVRIAPKTTICVSRYAIQTIVQKAE